MNNTAYIEIIVNGQKGNIPLSPDNFDIKEIKLLFESVENLLFPEAKNSRPIISYEIEKSSVKNIFKTTLQYIIGINAVLQQIPEVGNIDFLDVRTAHSIEAIQDYAKEKDYSIMLTTSLENRAVLIINSSTNYYRTDSLWADSEYYLFGKITNAGGKDRANIHLFTDEFGTLRITTPISYLDAYPGNLLYKKFGVRVKAKQNIKTGELDPGTLVFIELVDYERSYNRDYLSKIRDKAKSNWVGKVDTAEWLNDVKGEYDT